MSNAAETLGFRTLGVKLTLITVNEASLPCILHWNKDNFVVLYKIKKDIYYISDPAYGLLTYSKEEFLKH